MSPEQVGLDLKQNKWEAELTKGNIMQWLFCFRKGLPLGLFRAVISLSAIKM